MYIISRLYVGVMKYHITYFFNHLFFVHSHSKVLVNCSYVLICALCTAHSRNSENSDSVLTLTFSRIKKNKQDKFILHIILYCIIHTYICISFSILGVLNFRTILTATLPFIPRDLHENANEHHREILILKHGF